MKRRSVTHIAAIGLSVLLTQAAQAALAQAAQAAPAPAPASTQPPTPTALIENLRTLFTPLAASQGGTLRFEHDANDTSATASAHRDHLDEFVVRTTRGLMEHPTLDEESMRVMLCHELGHLFGGTPHRPTPMEWTGAVDENGDMVLSAEGQADYWAATVCMPIALASENNVEFVAQREIPAVVREQCSDSPTKPRVLTSARAQKQLETPTKANVATEANSPILHEAPPQDAAICMRTALAGYAMLRLTYPFAIAFETPAEETPEKTINGTYPTRQCRLDTIFAGARGESRPRCWFKP